MTNPQLPLSIRLATITGTWTPSSGTISADQRVQAQQAADQATKSATGVADGPMDFHIIATDYPGGPVYRTHWRLNTYISGPSLRADTTDPHPSQVQLMQVEYPHAAVRQVVADPAMLRMPYRGEMSSGVTALLARHAWGTEPRTLTASGFVTGTFTPETIRFGDMYNRGDIELPYDSTDDQLSTYAITQGQSGAPTAMWLSTDPVPGATWQISYCVAKRGQRLADRWDTPQSAPEFTPLDWPA
jgi:hypothetical protein